MTAHVVYAALDGAPATTSATMIARIRHDIGFDGLLMTDDIGMNALSGTPAQRAAAAIAAGCDVVLHCNGSREEMAQVVAASGRLTLPAAERAARALAARRMPDAVDIAAVEGELRALTTGAPHAG
jgi:beta-N-acetylhexosaminidase